MAIAQQPYAAVAFVIRSLSVTAKRPVGVGVRRRPTATRKRLTTRPPFRTVTFRRERSTRSDHGLATSDAAPIGIQPGRPFGSSVAITWSQRPWPPTTAKTRGEWQRVWVRRRATGRPFGARRSTVG